MDRYTIQTNTAWKLTSNDRRDACQMAKATLVKVLVSHSVVVDNETGEVIVEFVKDRKVKGRGKGNYEVWQMW